MYEHHGVKENLNGKTTPIKNNIKKKFLPLIALTLLIIFIAILCRHCPKPPIPPEEIWFEEGFKDGLEGWDYLDATWIDDQGVVFNTSAQLGRKVYLAPYLSHDFNPPIHKDQIVTEFYIKLEDFSGAAATLASLDFPTGEVTAIINGDRYLGLAFGLFEPAQYSNKRLTLGEWEKIQIYVNIQEGKVSLYHNDQEILITNWSGTQPLMKAWFGSTWIFGAENYGSMLECYYDAIRIGNSGLLAPQTKWGKIKAGIL